MLRVCLRIVPHQRTLALIKITRSKVRCSKTRPICSRCQRLGYPCFYSPARRIRKKSGVNNTSTAIDIEAGVTLNRPQNHTIPSPQEEVVNTPSASANSHGSLDGDKPLDDLGNSISVGGTDFHQTHVDSFFNTNQPHHEEGDLFSFGDVNMVDALDAGNTTFSPLPELHCDSLNLHFTSHQHNGSDSSLQSISSHDPNPVIETSEWSCAAVAANVLHSLNRITKAQSSSSATPKCISTFYPSQLSADDNISLDIVSMAIKRVSTILICPCSKRTDVGLLTAAICIGLLDLLDATVQSLMIDQPRSGSSSHKGLSSKDLDHVKEALEMSSQDIREGNDRNPSKMRVLDQLPKIADLVTQYSTRYSEQARNSEKELLQNLAETNLSRLKGVINQVTNRIAQID